MRSELGIKYSVGSWQLNTSDGLQLELRSRRHAEGIKKGGQSSLLTQEGRFYLTADNGVAAMN
jgi:hypothetical protein